MGEARERFMPVEGTSAHIVTAHRVALVTSELGQGCLVCYVSPSQLPQDSMSGSQMLSSAHIAYLVVGADLLGSRLLEDRGERNSAPALTVQSNLGTSLPAFLLQTLVSMIEVSLEGGEENLDFILLHDALVGPRTHLTEEFLRHIKAVLGFDSLALSLFNGLIESF